MLVTLINGCCICFTGEEGSITGSNTTVIVVSVIIGLCLLGALAVFLAMKYSGKSPEITPMPEKPIYGSDVNPGNKKRKTKRKTKHSSSTTGVNEVRGVSKKRGSKQKRSSSSKVMRVESQVLQSKRRQGSMKETLPS